MAGHLAAYVVAQRQGVRPAACAAPALPAVVEQVGPIVARLLA